MNGRVNDKAPAQMTGEIEVIMEKYMYWKYDRIFYSPLVYIGEANILAEPVFISSLIGDESICWKNLSGCESILLYVIGENNRDKNNYFFQYLQNLKFQPDLI